MFSGWSYSDSSLYSGCHGTQFCMVCHQAEDEACLLLCDSCDRGTHTYCCRPRLDGIPEGDWFCATCASSVRQGRGGGVSEVMVHSHSLL